MGWKNRIYNGEKQKCAHIYINKKIMFIFLNLYMLVFVCECQRVRSVEQSI